MVPVSAPDCWDEAVAGWHKSATALAVVRKRTMAGMGRIRVAVTES
jgi:hypothetical protein